MDERAKRTGAYIELLGTYNPLTEPKDIKLKQDRIDYWIKQGAKPSTGYLRIIGKAPQRPPRKPKKEKKEEKPAEETTSKESAKPEAVDTEATEAKAGAASRLSEAGESASESTSPDVHEPAQAGSPKGEAELEKRENK